MKLLAATKNPENNIRLKCTHTGCQWFDAIGSLLRIYSVGQQVQHGGG